MERLKLLMEKHNIKTQYALAKGAGIDYKVVNHWFTGRATPGEDNLFKLLISKMLEINRSFSFGESSNLFEIFSAEAKGSILWFFKTQESVAE